MTAARLAAHALLIALLAFGVSACGDQGDGTGSTSAPVAVPNDGAAGAPLTGGPGTGGETTPGSPASGETAPDAPAGASPAPGSAADGGSAPGSPADGVTPAPGSDPVPDPALALRAIVAESLAELAPLADPSAVYGNPAGYADLLETASGQIDTTIDRLEALDPPAPAASGTAALIAAYRDLGTAVDRGADAFSSGDTGQINAGRAYLTRAAGRFRRALDAAADSLLEAGVEVPAV